LFRNFEWKDVMNDFKKLTLVAAIIAGLAVVGFLTNSQQHAARAAGGPTVTIDPTQLPLPVQGSLGVSATIAATQSGGWTVGIGGNSASSPLFTRDADNPARQPFQTSLCFSVGTGAFPCSSKAPSFLRVPSDRRLVIEFVAGSCQTGPIGGTGLTGLGLGIATTAGGADVIYSLPYSFGLSELDIAQQTRIYADPGTSVSFGEERGAGGATPSFVTCVLGLSGYTVTP
jgi:hypothetical protein